ncbi:hypothetical protein AMTR_s00119p00091610, partial [Amborella trichopoda]
MEVRPPRPTHQRSAGSRHGAIGGKERCLSSMLIDGWPEAKTEEEEGTKEGEPAQEMELKKNLAVDVTKGAIWQAIVQVLIEAWSSMRAKVGKQYRRLVQHALFPSPRGYVSHLDGLHGKAPRGCRVAAAGMSHPRE